MALCLEDIDDLSLEDAVDWLEERSICYDLLETHDEILDLIRATLKNENPSRKQFSEDIITDCFIEYESMRRELSDFYAKDLKSFVKDHLDDELRAFINNIYTDIDSRMDRNHDDLIHSECAIVVAGETSSGKSSFLNLLIGSDVLPHSLLANTSAICQIHNSDQKQFQVVMESGHCCLFTIDGEGPDAEKDFVTKLKPYIGRSGVDGKDKIKHVNIYWPVPLLKKHITLVDTPGVGESPEMTEKLVKYLPNAVAFIYVINSANAGGIQEDTILRIISEQRKLATDQELSSFDEASMIFVCNKWDIVEKRAMAEETWQDTVQRLQRTIPGLKEDHIFKLSVTEATKYRRSGIGNTEMYQRLLQGLEQFIPGSLTASIKRHYRWLASLLSKIMTSVASRISNARKSAEEKEAFADSVRLRLKKLETSSKQVRSRLTEAANKECHTIVQELHKHLSKADIISYLQTWTEAEAPDIIEDDIEVTTYVAQRMINKRLLDVVQTWETETRIVEKAAQNISRLFNKECLFLSQECKVVDEVLTGKSLSVELGLISDWQPKSEPQPTTEDVSFDAIDIAIIAAASPIWVPLGVVALAIAVPAAIGYGITHSVKHVLEKRKYRKDKAKYMRKWARDSLPKFETISLLIENMYLQHMFHRINSLCSEFIPKQIEADKTQLRSIANDNRSAAQIFDHFGKMNDKLKGLYGTLYLFDLKYLAKDFIGISKILRYKQIGSGSFSDVYRATWRQTNGDEKEVALKILKGHDLYLQLSEVDCSRRLRHENIVEFYGVVLADRERYHDDKQKQDTGLPLYDDRLMLVLDLCEQSLESLVFNTTEFQCGSFPCNLRTRKTHQYFFEMAISICEGLEYMHDMKCLHRDLKLSNVLVKNGIGKLCDLGFARAEVHITGTVVGTLTHMAPELLNATIYSFSSDVYSLGILLWELWYGKSSYSDAKFGQLGVGQFISAVTEGVRPDCELENTMVPNLKILVEKCWGNHANTRPNVEEVKTKLKKIDIENRRDISR